MHGLINRSIQSFLRDTYGQEFWRRVARDARLGFENFEAMLAYDDALTDAVLNAAARALDRPREALLEDLGTYLVSHPNLEPLRRLLRFGGVSFVDFLHSLDDLPERGRLAVPDLELPRFELHPLSAQQFLLRCTAPRPGFGHVMVGVLRAMADDYGALAMLDYTGRDGRVETITIDLLETRFAAGRPFSLASGTLH
jgi:hypothetical protein